MINIVGYRICTLHLLSESTKYDQIYRKYTLILTRFLNWDRNTKVDQYRNFCVCTIDLNQREFSPFIYKNM